MFVLQVCRDKGADIKPAPRPGRNSCYKLSNYSSFPIDTISVQHTKFAEVRK